MAANNNDVDRSRFYKMDASVADRWRDQFFKPQVKEVKCHDDHLITCLELVGNQMISASDDSTVKVWSVETGECLKTLVGHAKGVWSLQASEAVIVSGSCDHTLKIWDAKTGECLHTCNGHTSVVRCLHLFGNKVTSGGRDGIVFVWACETGDCLATLKGHTSTVRAVQYNGKIVVSGSYDKQIRVWDPELEVCLATLQGHTGKIIGMKLIDEFIYSGSFDKTVRVWNLKTQKKEFFMGHQHYVTCIDAHNDVIVSGSSDTTLRIWYHASGNCRTLAGKNGHQYSITAVLVNDHFVVSSSFDSTIKLWDVKTARFIRNILTLEVGGIIKLQASDTKLVCILSERVNPCKWAQTIDGRGRLVHKLLYKTVPDPGDMKLLVLDFNNSDAESNDGYKVYQLSYAFKSL